jgi:predicted ATPase/DNA-binding SARP family transcriptional activator
LTLGVKMGDHDPGSTLRVNVLGPLQLVVAGAAVDVRGPKRRAVLALLAIAGGRAVTADHLVDALWPATPPESGRAALHSHMSRLRAHLGPGAARLITGDGAYRLLLDADGLDVQRARVLLNAGRDAARGDPAAACRLLREALALWRGPALADLFDVAPIAAAVVGFEQLRQEVSDLLISCAIDAGQLDGVVSLAADALAVDPLREPVVLLLMRALAATGQPAQALQAGRAYRRRLAKEAGLDPSAKLGEIERRIAQGTLRPVRADKESGASVVRSTPSSPLPASRLIGRDVELVAVNRLLSTERLVTIVGPGGVGKTRLALELARQADTAGVLRLASVVDPATIPAALAETLGLREVRGDVLAACTAVLNGRSELLVVDSCEHLLAAAGALLGRILDSCPRLTVLATSRQPLGLALECPFRLAPLPLPSAKSLTEMDAAGLERIPSVAVFLERAIRVRPAFTPDADDLRAVGEIVRRLDGIPLAIELAAGRLSTYSAADLSHRLDRALDLLGAGGVGYEDRHRTLRSTLEWSYQLLSADERSLFRHLAIFADGVDLAAAETLAADLGLVGDPGPALAHLVEASMIIATFDGRTRYRMLEPLRTFGLDRLTAAGEHDAAKYYLMRWAVNLSDWIDAVHDTEHESKADATIRRELGNLRSAWRFAQERGALDEQAAMVLALSDATSWRDVTEALSWAEELAADPALLTHSRASAVLGAAANAAYLRGDYAAAEQLARIGLERATDAEGRWRCLSALALTDLSRAAYDDAVEHSLAAAALAPRPSENLGVAALASTYDGDLERGRKLNEQMLAAAASPTLRAFGAYVNGEIDNAAGRPCPAEEHYSHAIELARASGATFVVGIASVGLLTLLTSAGRVENALRGYGELVDYWHRSGNWTQQWVTLRNLAALLGLLGAHDTAAVLNHAADQAPDAPSTDRTGGATTRMSTEDTSGAAATDRARVLDIAHQAIAEQLAAFTR